MNGDPAKAVESLAGRTWEKIGGARPRGKLPREPQGALDAPLRADAPAFASSPTRGPTPRSSPPPPISRTCTSPRSRASPSRPRSGAPDALHDRVVRAAPAARMLSTYVYFAVFFGLGFLLMSIAGGAFSNASVEFGAGRQGLHERAALDPVLTDARRLPRHHHRRRHRRARDVPGRRPAHDVAFFFTAPISKLDYLGGRFLGALLSMLVLYPGLALGSHRRRALPVHRRDARRAVGSRRLRRAVPDDPPPEPRLHCVDLLRAGDAPPADGSRCTSGAVVLVLGYLISANLTANIDNRTLAALLDPFGGNAADRLTEYWTIAEKNTRLVPLTGVFLWNRVLWTAARRSSSLALTYARFSFAERAAGAEAPLRTTCAEPAPGRPAAAPRRSTTRRARRSPALSRAHAPAAHGDGEERLLPRHRPRRRPLRRRDRSATPTSSTARGHGS